MQKLPLSLLNAPSNSDGFTLKIVGGVVVAQAVAAPQTYTAGTGLTLNSGQFAADTTVLATQNYVNNATSTKANIASPTFTGTPAAPTATAGTSTTQLATTAFATAADNLKANIASPTFTGTPQAPTPATGTATTQIATAAFVHAQIASNVARVIPLEVIGKMTASEKVRLFTAPFSGTINTGISPFTAGVAATASTTITVLKNGTQVGTLVWAANSTAPTVNFTTTSVTAFDVFTFTGPATPDATLADITGYLKIS